MSTCLQYVESDGVAEITLSRPDAANSLDRTLTRELADMAAHCDRSASVKAVLLTGSGRFFCAGGDLKSILDSGQAAGTYVKSVADDLHKAISTFARMSSPLVVAVNGVAAGAGFSLALAGDLVLAASSATFTMAYTRAGLSPDGSSTFYLPRVVGLRRATELMLTNRTLTAPEAAAWGLANQVVPDDALGNRARHLTRELADGAWRSQASAKKLLLLSWGRGLEEQMELEGRAIAECAGSSDGQEGMKAFREKRRARFALAKGR